MKKALKIFMPLFFILLALDIGYKGYLLIETSRIQKNNVPQLKARKIYGDDINLLCMPSKEEFSYERLHMTNILENYEHIGDNTYKLKDEEKYIQIYKDNILKELNLTGVEKYLEKNNIKDDKDIYNFLKDYSKTSVNIFSSYSDIKNEIFRASLYQITYFSYEEAHNLIGDYEGYVFKNKDKITYYIYDGDTKYGINFIGFDSINVTNELISTINFK